jgi:alanyl-tRNA synthetase
VKNFLDSAIFSSITDLSSRVTFHRGSIEEESSVEAVLRFEGTYVLLTGTTPFHPRDYQWPDQPEDAGYIEKKPDEPRVVSDAVVTALSPEGTFYCDADIPVKKNTEQWRYFVGHLIEGDRPEFAPGDRVSLHVDAGRRLALSRVHSASHLMGLALNQVLAPLWKKDPGRADGLGHPNFDSIAMESSKIEPLVCTDIYHLGKSLRKKGFEREELFSDPDSFEGRLNELASRWIAADSPIEISAEGDLLTDRRYWSANLGGTAAEIPCGGTHAKKLSDIGAMRSSFEIDGDETLIIRTSVR